MNNKFKYNPSFNIRYPEIKVKHDDEIANTFFSFVIGGDVNKLNQYIVENSVPISIKKEKDGRNALHLATESSLPLINKLNIINYLLINYIPVNDRDLQGNTPLLIASKNNEKEVVDTLLNYGADPSIKNMFGINALHYAAGGTLESCQDIKMESIIEEPTSNEFKDMEINELSLAVKDLYNKLLNDYGNLGNVELTNTSKDFPKRIPEYLAHIKYIFSKINDYESINPLIEANNNNLLSEYKKILSIKDKNPNELKKKIVIFRSNYIDKYVEIIKKLEDNPFLPFDMQSMKIIRDDDEGIFLQDQTGENNDYIGYYKIDGTNITLNQEITTRYDIIQSMINGTGSQLNNYANDYLSLINANSGLEDLIFQIKNSGQQIQKLELFQNIERLKEYGRNAANYNDYKKINTNPAGNNPVNLFTAYKNLISNTDTTNNFGIPQLNQTDNTDMAPYKIKAGVGANAFNLVSFNDNITDNANIYDQNILQTFTYDDYKPFTDERNNNKIIEINFREPVSMLFSNSNFSGALANAPVNPQLYFNNNGGGVDATNLIFKEPTKNGAGWIFTPSNGCHNIIKMSLEYKNLTDVKITLTYLIQIAALGATLVQRTISSEFIRDVRIVYLQRTSDIAAGNATGGGSLVNNITPWRWLTPATNKYTNMFTQGANQQTVKHDDADSIKLSFAATGGNDVYGTQNIYNPLYAFHKGINSNYLNTIQDLIEDISSFKFDDNDIKLTNYKDLIDRVVRLVKYLLRFHTRYQNMLNAYTEVIDIRYKIVDDIINELQREYNNSDLLQDIRNSLKSSKWDYTTLQDSISQNSDLINESIEVLIDNIKDINDLNILAHFWNSNSKLFKINRTLQDRDSFFKNFNLQQPEYDKEDDEDNFIGNTNIDNDSDVKHIVRRNKNKVRGIEFTNLDTGKDFDFSKPSYMPLGNSIITSYSSFTRLRILEELLLFIFHNRDTDKLDGKIKDVYSKITTSIKDNFGITNPEILAPLALSVIGDFLDVRLINDIKKQFLEIANESFLKLIQSAIYKGQINIDTTNTYKFTIDAGSTSWISDGHPKAGVSYNLYSPSSTFIGTMTTTNEDKTAVTEFTLDNDTIDLTTLRIGTNNITIKLDTEDISSPITFGSPTIDPSTLDIDVPFELDLNSIDDNVKDTIKNKISGLNSSLVQILNKGDKLVIDPEFKYHEHISDNSKAKDQQIYYSTGFLDNSSENMCIKYNNDLLLAILNKFPDVNISDMYGNTPLLYAIKTNNYLAIRTLLENNARVLFKNNDGVSPLHYALDKLKNICGYFPDDNLITSINKSYIIGLKDELAKIDSSHNIMKNYDKLVELYLFLYNSMAYTNLYANNYNLLIKFIELSKEELAKTFMKEDSDKFPLLLVNPLYQFIEQNEKIQDSLKSKAYVKQNVPSVLLANMDLLEEENKKLEMEIKQLEQKIEKAAEYKTLVEGNYQSNITEKISKLENERDIKLNKLKANKKLINKINGKIDKEFKNKTSDFSKFRNMPKKTKDLINQNIIVSQLFQDENLSYEDSKVYLGVLDKMLQSEKYGMSAYNVHSHLNKQMKNFVEEMEDYLSKKYYTTDDLKLKKIKCEKIKELVKETLSNQIFSKKSFSRRIAKNEKLEDIFNILCFTIDQIVGYSFYKVLFRLIMTYFSKILPKGTTKDDEYIKFIGDKTKIILETSAGEKLSVKNIILPNYSDLSDPKAFKYTPSYITKRMVSTICGIKLPEKYSEDDNDTTFNLIAEIISANNVMPIDSKSKIIKYLLDKIIPYFKKYYTISIKTLNNLTSSYENMIQNQYVLLKIIDELLDKTVNDSYQLQVL